MSALARTALVFVSAGPHHLALRGRYSLARASVVTSVGKTHCHLPKALPDVYRQLIAGTSPDLRWFRVWDVEGVTSLALLPKGSAVGVKEDALVVAWFLYCSFRRIPALASYLAHRVDENLKLRTIMNTAFRAFLPVSSRCLALHCDSLRFLALHCVA